MYSSQREARDRRYRRFKDASSTEPFDTEYTSRYRTRQSVVGRGKRKQARQKNASQLSSVLRDRPETQQHGDRPVEEAESVRTSDRDEKSEVDTYEEPVEEEEEEGGERNPSTESCSSQPGAKSDGSNDQEAASGHQERAHSSSSVKFPRIQASPPVAPDSARSVQGAGATPPKMPNLPSPEDPASSLSQRPMSLTRLQPLDSSRWVEGKGAGRLHLFFQILEPPAESDNPTWPATQSQAGVVRPEAGGWLQGEGRHPSHEVGLGQLPPPHLTANGGLPPPPTSPTPPACNIPSLSGNAGNVSNNDIGITSANYNRGRCNLSRSRSDSELYLPHTRANNSNNVSRSTLRAGQNISLDEKAVVKTTEEGTRPETQQQTLILAPEARASQPQLRNNIATKQRTQKSASSKTKVPNHQYILTKRNLQQGSGRWSVPRPQTTVFPRGRSHQPPGGPSPHPGHGSYHAHPPSTPQVNTEPWTETHEFNKSDLQPKTAAQHNNRWSWMSLKRRKLETSKLGHNPPATTKQGHRMPIRWTRGRHCRRNYEAQEMAAMTRRASLTCHTQASRHLGPPLPQLHSSHHSGSSAATPGGYLLNCSFNNNTYITMRRNKV